MAFTQPDCPPAVAEAVMQVLRSEDRPVAGGDFEASLAPGSDFDRRAVAMVVRDLVAIGVVVEEGGETRLNERAARLPTNAAAIRFGLFDSVDPGSLFDLGGDGKMRLDGGRDLVRALAWFLMLDVPRAPYDYKGGIDELQGRELGVELVNRERWLPFWRWGSYLGLIRVEAGAGVTPDPSLALADLLAASPAGSSWMAAEFLNLVARELPVLDGGRFSDAVAKRRKPAQVDDSAEADVSSALAFALLILEREGKLKLEQSTGDAKKLRLPHELGAFSGVSVDD